MQIAANLGAASDCESFFYVRDLVGALTHLYSIHKELDPGNHHIGNGIEGPI